jgi:hypothetical protein
VAAAREDQVEEEHPVDQLGALPEQVVPEEEAVHQHEAEEAGDAGLVADHERGADRVEQQDLRPHRPRRVPEVQQRVLLALEVLDPAGGVEEAVGVVADAVAEALELARRDQLAGGVAEEDALVGEQELEVLEDVVDVADAEEREHDAKQRDRPRVLEGQEEPPPALALQHEQGVDTDRAGQEQPADRRRQGDRELVRNAIFGEHAERKVCGRREPKHTAGSVSEARTQAQGKTPPGGALRRRGAHGSCRGGNLAGL